MNRRQLLALGAQPIIVTLLFTVVSVSAVGWFAYRSARRTILSEVVRTVEAAAEGRKVALGSRLGLQRERATGFLHATHVRCEDDAECSRAALETFVAAEHAGGARLAWSTGVVVNLGGEVPGPSAGRAIEFRTDGSVGRFYVLQVSAGGSTLTLRFATEQHLDPIFRAAYGLGRSGESFLADAAGYFLTTARYHSASGVSHPIHASPMRACLSGRDGWAIDPDYRGVQVIHGYRTIDEIGGGCIMAHVDYDEAMAPARTLRTSIVGLGALLVALAVGWSLYFRRSFAGPLERLGVRARALEGGDFATPVAREGPPEIRAFADAFAAMAGSLARSQTELAAAVRHRDEFISMASHELRTPLTALKLTVESAKLGVGKARGLDPALAARLEKALGISSRQVDRLAGLVEQMLDIGRLQQGKLALNVQEADLAAIARRTVEELAPHMAAADSTVELRADAPVVAKLDPFRIEQVVVNLLSNALKYGGGKPVVVSVAEVGDLARLSVADQGLGIAPEDQERIFVPFQRAASVGHYAGMGLGLAIAREVVVAHGGTLRVTSAVGQGATFVVELPRG